MKSTKAANGGRPITHFYNDEVDFKAMGYTPQQIKEILEYYKPKKLKHDQVHNLLFGTSGVVEVDIYLKRADPLGLKSEYLWDEQAVWQKPKS